MKLTDNGKDALIFALLMALIAVMLALILVIVVPYADSQNYQNAQTIYHISDTRDNIICDIYNDTLVITSSIELEKINNTYYLSTSNYDIVITKK